MELENHGLKSVHWKNVENNPIFFPLNPWIRIADTVSGANALKPIGGNLVGYPPVT